MKHRRGRYVAALAALAVASCVPSGPKAPTTPNRYHGRLAIRAALEAAPHPPRNVEELGVQLQRLEALSFDEDRDGALEFDEWAESEFASLLLFNSSHDGKIKVSEYIADREVFPPKPVKELEIEDQREFELLDVKHHGYLTIDDMRDLYYKTFMLNDINRDGKVTEKEIDQVARSGSTGHLFP